MNRAMFTRPFSYPPRHQSQHLTLGHHAQSGIVLIIALIIDLVKKGDAAGTWQESHFDWRIRSTLWCGFWYLVTAPLWLLLIVPGWIAWGIISIWFLYRVVKGMVKMNANKAIA